MMDDAAAAWPSDELAVTSVRQLDDESFLFVHDSETTYTIRHDCYLLHGGFADGSPGALEMRK